MTYMIKWDSGHQIDSGVYSSLTLFGNNIYCILGIQSNDWRLYKSENGETWTLKSTLPTVQGSYPYSSSILTSDGNQLIVLRTTEGNINTSTDCVNWTTNNSLYDLYSDYSWRTIVYGNNLYIVGGFKTVDDESTYYYTTSSDLINWTTPTSIEVRSGTPTNPRLDFLDNDFYLTVEACPYKSSDGVNWTKGTVSISHPLVKFKNYFVFNTKLSYYNTGLVPYAGTHTMPYSYSGTNSFQSAIYVEKLDRIVATTYDNTVTPAVVYSYIGKLQPVNLNAYVDNNDYIYTENTSLAVGRLLYNDNGTNIGAISTVSGNTFTTDTYPFTFTLGSGVTSVQIFDTVYTSGDTVDLIVGTTVYLKFVTTGGNSTYTVGVNSYNTARTDYVPMEVNSSSVYFPTVFETYHSGGTYSGSVDFTWSNTFK